MRTRQAVKNTAASLLLQVILAISGILVPRYFTFQYGSAVNGLETSINQFISYLALVEAGVSAAGVVALYGPLARGERENISAVLSAARQFYLRSGMIFVALAAALVLGYPYLVQGEIQDHGFVRTMILILCVSGIVDYFYLGKYRILLQADQRGYVLSMIQIAGSVLGTVVSLVLIRMAVSPLLVKAVVAVVYLLRSLAAGWYVRAHYPYVNFHAEPRMSAFGQRWSALFHQIVGMIVTNSTVVLVTLFRQGDALVEVSVYSVYNLVGYALSGLMTALVNGIGASFGQVMAAKEEQVLWNSYRTYEYLFFILIFAAYCCMAVLLYPFVYLYSMHFADAGLYPRWDLVMLITLTGLTLAIRQPASTLIYAAGHYRQTQSRAAAEALIGLGVSIVLVRPMGLAGVLLGRLVSAVYRTVDVILYDRRFLPRQYLGLTVRRLALNSVVFGLLTVWGKRWIPQQMTGWGTWFGCAVLFGCVCCAVFVAVNFAAERSQGREALSRAAAVFGKK